MRFTRGDVRGPYRFIQNRSRISVVALKSDAAAEKPKDQLSRDFLGCSIFDFCNNICHVWTAPSWQELSSRTQAWSVLPCVRPFGADRLTAGHNALRGSGPGQKPAFEDAMAQVGCPDRRIDRLCITCCSPSQPSHHAGCPARYRLPRKSEGVAFLLSSVNRV